MSGRDAVGEARAPPLPGMKDRPPPAWERARDARAVEPLVDARNAWPAMEEAVLGARREVLASFRLLDPQTGLVSAGAAERGLSDWGALLADALRRGVDLRIALADFDPLHANGLHRYAWACAAHLAAALGPAAAGAQGRVELLCVPHEGEVGAAVRWLAFPATATRLFRLVKRLREETAEPGAVASDGRPVAHDGVGASPGLWTHADPHGERRAARVWPPVPLWPATHHQKLLVADGNDALVGGLDVNPRRWDGIAHDRPAHQTWHDVVVRTAGPGAEALADWFARFWNDEIVRERRLRRARGQGLFPGMSAPSAIDAPSAATDRRAPGRGRARREEPDAGPEAGHAPGPDGEATGAGRKASNPAVQGEDVRDGAAMVRVVATASRRARSPLALGPRAVRTEIEEAYLDLFAGARRLLYVETQFLRSARLAGALAERARARPDLVLVALLPAAPEDVAFKGDHGLAMRHGEWLQVRAVERIRRAFGARAGFFTLGKRRARSEASERDAVFGAGTVYVHAKVAIADDARAIVASANLNGRSMRWDTEVGLAFEAPDSARRLRRELFASHLGAAAAGALPDDPAGMLEGWRRRALDNVLREPEERAGLVLPYPLEQARRFARRVPFMPRAAL